MLLILYCSNHYYFTSNCFLTPQKHTYVQHFIVTHCICSTRRVYIYLHLILTVLFFYKILTNSHFFTLLSFFCQCYLFVLYVPFFHNINCQLILFVSTEKIFHFFRFFFPWFIDVRHHHHTCTYTDKICI